MKRYKLFFFSIMVCLSMAVLLTSCDEVDQQQHEADYRLNLVDVSLSPDFKQMQVDAVMSNPLSAMFLKGDTSLKMEVTELVDNEFDERTQPELVDVRNIVTETLKAMDLTVMALVDLTVDSTLVLEQQEAVRGIKKLFSVTNFNVSFIKDHSVSETLISSEYVLDNYFKAVEGEKFLYRSLYQKMREYSKPKDDKDSTSRKVIIAFSDGKVYNEENHPIDSAHFHWEHRLLEAADSTTAPLLFYVDLNKLKAEEDRKTEDSENIISLLCQQTKGRYLANYNENKLLSGILGTVNQNAANYRYIFKNPDLKVYQGNKHVLHISYYHADSLFASDFIDYYAASVYNPVIINGPTVLQIVMQGLLLVLLILLVVYIVFQYIIPALSYLWFRKKHVTHYTGENMSYNGIMVNKECYFCKAPFEKGDEIVVKCKHVMHKSCWDENGYKCPEYGRNCKQGSHYYNHHKLYDPQNASFYMKWTMIGLLAGYVAWMSFSFVAADSTNSVFEQIIPYIFGVEAGSMEATHLVYAYGSHLFLLPLYGLNIGFFLTLGLSLLVGHGCWWGKRLLLVLCKAIAGGFAGFTAFFLGSLVSIILNFKDNSFLIDWFPWLLSGFAITCIVAFGTDVKLKRALVGAAISIVFGLGSMYIWSYTASSQTDTRELALLSYLIYCTGFAVSIATTYPRSERYFLRVEGPIKTMDIALYKWMNASILHKRVTIGKSVNCELQMSWDIMGNIAPVQAEVKMVKGYLYLIPLDKGVYQGKRELPENFKLQLYHGTKFKIGNTLFTYLEKDI